MQSELQPADDCGSAAAHCGEALPFRCSSFFEGEAMPRLGGVASSFFRPRGGKAEPYRTVLRQSRKGIRLGMVLIVFVSVFNYSSNAHSRSIHSQEGFEMPVQE